MDFTKIASGWIETEDKPAYHGWPTVCCLKNGRLLAAASGGRADHVCPFGRAYCYTSDDGGFTWSKPQILSSGPLDDRDCGLAVAADGSVLLSYFTSIFFTRLKNRPEAWNEVMRKITLETLEKEHGVWMRRSTDGGRTWSPKYRVPVLNNHGPTPMNDGSLLWVGAEVGNTVSASFSNSLIRAYRSTDNGLTWQLLSALPEYPGLRHADWFELHTAQTAKGLVITQFRNHGDPSGRTATWQIESADGGLTWGKCRPVCLGYPTHLLRLADGRIVMSYGWRHEPCGVRCRIGTELPDDYYGAAAERIRELVRGLVEPLREDYWSEELVLCDDGETVDLGYPSTAQLPDGTLLTLWYQFRRAPGIASLRWLKWKLD